MNKIQRQPFLNLNKANKLLYITKSPVQGNKLIA